MKIFTTADPHFGHANIIRYCDRPFRDLDHMNAQLIHRWNERVKPEDTTIIVGDFCFKNSPGGKAGEGTINRHDFYANQLNGKKIFIRGNHDGGNSNKTPIMDMTLKFAKMLIGVMHRPQDFFLTSPHGKIDFCICGHVHQNWKHKWVKNEWDGREMLMVNVGVDVWKFYPITLDEVVKYASKVRREGYNTQEVEKFTSECDLQCPEAEVGALISYDLLYPGVEVGAFIGSAIKQKLPGACACCRSKTYWVDIDYNCYLCSKKCVETFDKANSEKQNISRGEDRG